MIVAGLCCIVLSVVGATALHAVQEEESTSTRATAALQPSHWYRFEDPNNKGKDSVGGLDINVPSHVHYESGFPGLGPIGGYLQSKFNASMNLQVPAGNSVEFLFSTASSGFFIKGRLWLLLSTVWELRYPWNEFIGELKLDKTGAMGLNYATKGWHHVAISMLPNNTVLFCLDGNVCFNGTHKSPPSPDQVFEFVPLPIVQGFGIDEIAVYNGTLSQAEIWLHYQDTMKRYVKYSFPDKLNATVPTPSFPPLDYTEKEFPPGTNLSTSPTSGVNISALEQLEQFPDPQYPTDTVHLFERNFNWMDPGYMAGRGQKGVDPATLANVTEAIQENLYKKWHYGVVLSNLRTCCSEEDIVTVKAASKYAKKVDVIIMRLQTEGGTQLYNHSLPDGCYIQDSKGNFYNAAAHQVASKAQASLRPMSAASAAKVGCPDSVFYADGEKFNTSLNNLEAILTPEGMTFNRINNDGEAMNIISGAVADVDPVIKADFEASGEPNWLTYWSHWRWRLSAPGFSDLFMQNRGSGRFTQYQIQGTNPWFGNWTVTRHIMQRLKNNQFYSCADFYPRWPNIVFDVSAGPWHGLGWMKDVRASEIANGNPFFSPFVAAGWGIDAQQNIRPAQWLGLLKLFGAWGAEFYYAGFFSLGQPFPPSQNWIWQAAMPSYAQAITAKYADVFFNGTFEGFLDTGMTNVFGVVRKAVNTTRAPDNRREYIIVLTIQPLSNYKGNALSEFSVTVDIPGTGDQLYLSARRQGSVYRYLPDGCGGTVGECHSLEQLDSWHEDSHPIYWGKK